MRSLLVGLAVVVAAVAAAWFVTDSESQPPPSPADLARVERVVDGDTVVLDIAGQRERARLIGIDAPESVAQDRPVQCYGHEASVALAGLLPPGSTVEVTRDSEPRDRFGRLLVYLHRPSDELFVNEWLVANGFADTLFLEPNTRLRSQFTAVRNEARSARRGLWGVCDGPDQPL